MNQKLPVRTRILCSFRIWAQKFLLSSLVKSNEIIFEKSKKLVWDKIFSTHFCSFSTYLKGTQTSQKLQIVVRISCLFQIRAQKCCVYFYSRVVRDFLKSLNNKATVFVYSINSFSSTLRIVRVGRFVERILLYNK